MLLRNAEKTSYHKALQNIYPRHYGKPTKNDGAKVKIVPYRVDIALHGWCELRSVADYIVFDEQFEDAHLEVTLEHIVRMESFVKDHLKYFMDNHAQSLTIEQSEEVGEIIDVSCGA